MVILSTKLKNAIVKAKPNTNYDFHLKNIIINGNKRGCSGFVVNKDNDTIVYVTTEPCSNLGFMYRYADTIKDFRGYTNRWSKTFETLVSDMTLALSKPNPEKRGE